MGFELIFAGLISLATAITVNNVVLPSAFNRYEKHVEKQVNSNRVFLGLSQNKDQ